MAYVYSIHIVVDDDPDNPAPQNLIEEAIEKALKERPGLQYVSAGISELEETNTGKCCQCGAWVSDRGKHDFVNAFSDGCKIDGNWWCDLCLPPDHPKRF